MEYNLDMNDQIDIVIPVYESSSTIQILLERIEKVVLEANLKASIILVEDGSKDNSWELIRKWMLESSLKSTAIRLYKNYGQHPATMVGLKYTSGDFVVIMDCDLQDQPEAIPFLLSKIKENDSDLVVVRSKEKRSLIVNITSRIFHTFNSAPSNITTFRMARKSLIELLLKFPEAYKLSGPVLLEISRKTDFMDYQRSERVNGSRYTFSARLGIGMKFIVSRSTSIVTTFFMVALGVALLSLIYMSTIFYQVIANQHPLPSGLNQIVILLSFIVSFSSFGFGFILLLLREILGYVKGNPNYEISVIERSNW